MSVPAPDERLSAYLDDELDASERRAVDELLGSSPAWRAELDAVGGARDALRSLPVRDAPAGFWDRLLREGPAVPTVEQPTGVRARAHRRRLPWVAAAAAAAAAVIAVLSVPSSERVSPRVPQLTDSHAVRSSESDDPVTQLATLSRVAPHGR